MATIQSRNGKWRALVRRKGFKAVTRTFPTKTAAKTWADRKERELADKEARGERDLDNATLAEVVEWYKDEIAQFSRITSTQGGNLTRLVESLGDKVARLITSDDIIEHVKRRRSGQHVAANGHTIPACGGATMNVELSFLDAVFKVAKVSKLTMDGDPIAEARPALRLRKLVSKSKRRDRRPTAGELQMLREHFDASAWRSKIPMNDIVDFAIATAKRESEITRLLRSDLDTENRTALLRDAKHPRSKEGNHRRFALLGEAWTIVERQPVIMGQDRIFPYNPKSIGTRFTRACQKLGITDLHFHDLRHEGTSRLFEQGYDIPQVASVTLHESWQELKRYTQIKPESLHRDTTEGKP